MMKTKSELREGEFNDCFKHFKLEKDQYSLKNIEIITLLLPKQLVTQLIQVESGPNHTSHTDYLNNKVIYINYFVYTFYSPIIRALIVSLRNIPGNSINVMHKVYVLYFLLLLLQSSPHLWDDVVVAGQVNNMLQHI